VGLAVGLASGFASGVKTAVCGEEFWFGFVCAFVSLRFLGRLIALDLKNPDRLSWRVVA
jgi:hydrogenase/urease accessory protein HupE